MKNAPQQIVSGLTWCCLVPVATAAPPAAAGGTSADLGVAVVVAVALGLTLGLLGCRQWFGRRLRRWHTALHRCRRDPDHEEDLQAVRSHQLEPLGTEVLSLLQQNRDLRRDLRLSEANYKGYVDEYSDFVCHFQADGALTFVNDAYARHCDSDSVELLGKSCLHALTPAWRRRVESEHLALDHMPDKQEFDCQVIAADGQPRWQHWTWLARRDEDGRLQMIQAVGRDITAQRQAEIVQQQQAELHKTLFLLSKGFVNLRPEHIEAEIENALQTAGEFADADAAFVYYSDSDRTRLHLRHQWHAEEAPSYSPYPPTIALDELPWLQQQLDTAKTIQITGGEELPADAARERAFMRELQIRSSLLIPMSLDRNRTGFIGVDARYGERRWPAHAITLLTMSAELIASAVERREAINELEKGRQRLHRILTAVQTGIFVIDLESRALVEVNDQACRLVGATREQLLQSQSTRVFDSLPAMPGRAEENLSWQSNDELKTWSARRVPVLRTTVSITLDGRPHLVESVVDLTQQKRLEKEHLMRERLQGVLEMAGAACHELNQPLQVITGYAELLLYEADEDAPAYHRLKALKEQADRLSALTTKINNITTYQTQEYLNGQIVDIDGAAPDGADGGDLAVLDRLDELFDLSSDPDDTTSPPADG